MEAALRWSPHSLGDRQRFLYVNIVDPSLTLNQVDRLEDRHIKYHSVASSGKLPSFTTFDWSRSDESVIGLGLGSGSASIVRLYDDGRPSETTATFKPRQQRKCNCISFSTEDWLAVAVDKTRSDFCLFIYDVGNATEPVRRLCAAGPVSSVRFFTSQPKEIVATTQKSYIRLYDLREGAGGAGGSVQAMTRNVNNIAIDPLDENYFASAGAPDDPAVSVWDKRWISHAPAGSSSPGAVFEWRPVVDNTARTTVWSLRYSGSCRGRLGICSSTGELKVIDTAEHQSLSVHASGRQGPESSHRSEQRGPQRYVSSTQVLEHCHHHKRRGRESRERIIAFDWIAGDENTADQKLVALRSSRELDLKTVALAKPQAMITARNDLSWELMQRANLGIAEPSASPPLLSDAADQDRDSCNTARDFGPHAHEIPSRRTSKASRLGFYRLHDANLSNILAESCVQVERCARGLLFDCDKNINIVSGDWHLERLWEIVRKLRDEASDDGMVFHGLDLSYMGVNSLWAETIGDSANRRTSPGDTSVGEALLGVANAKGLPAFEGERTNFPEHRQVCLAMCGWNFTTEALEAECQELIDRGMYYQAIVQAVLHGHRHIALNLLRYLIRTKHIQNIGLGALLAADQLNAEQRDMCEWMSADTGDTALKALLTFLTTGNWRDVMKTTYLHLGYRLALGLVYLNDTELSGFLQSETARAVRNGDLEGIVLTGLGEQAMDLFQTYIVRTNDLQTAVLAMAFTSPGFVDDVRWDMWKEAYFAQMLSWGAITAKARFAVQHAKMTKTKAGRKFLDVAPAQVTVLCVHCQGDVSKMDRHSTGTRPSAISEARSASVRVGQPPANAGTICPRCGRHMPRCGVCLTWVGTPVVTRAKPHPLARGLADESAAGVTRRPDASKVDQLMAQMLAVCVRCEHAFHAHHAREWFEVERHNICPVPDCVCNCMVSC